MGILSRLSNPTRHYKKRYGRNYPWSRYNKIGYISDSATGYTSSSFLKFANKKASKLSYKERWYKIPLSRRKKILKLQRFKRTGKW